MKKSITSFDRYWILSLFGTAVGAGILFLPIRAGQGGFWPIVIMSFLVFPMCWLSHRGLARFVNSSKTPGCDITKVAEEHFGKSWGLAITILYFFAIYPICLAYGVGITNTFDQFLIEQLGMGSVLGAQIVDKGDGTTLNTLTGTSRFVLVFILVAIFQLILSFKEDLVLKICSAFVIPLCFILLGFSIYLIPQWKIMEAISYAPEAYDFLIAIWLTLPVLVFSFNHSPLVSTMAMSIEKEYGSGENSDYKTNQIEFHTSVILLFFVMFFVFSCVMSVSVDNLVEARAQNIPILSYFANELNNPLIAYMGPIIAFLAITTSYFGHYYGCKEGLNGIVRKVTKKNGKQTISDKAISRGSNIFLFTTILLVGYANPSILGFIESLGGPIIAAILFIMPVVAIYKIPAMAKYKNFYSDIFIIITGSLAILSVLYKLVF